MLLNFAIPSQVGNQLTDTSISGRFIPADSFAKGTKVPKSSPSKVGISVATVHDFVKCLSFFRQTTLFLNSHLVEI